VAALSPDNTSGRPVTTRAAFAPVINNGLSQIAAQIFPRHGLVPDLTLPRSHGRRQMTNAPVPVLHF
jgi:hypothetical protein